MAAWDSFRRLFHPRRILWQNWSGFYCVGLDQLCPMEVVSCIDDGREYDLIEQRSRLRFCSLERGAGRRAKFIGPALEEVVPGVRQRIEGILREDGGRRWVIVCPLPCRTFSAFAAERRGEFACPDAEAAGCGSRKRALGNSPPSWVAGW
jgi:hypothetical protein